MKQLIFVVAIFLLLLAAADAVYAQDKATFKVGAIIPLTGDYADIGREVQRGIDLRVAEIKDVSIQVIYEDMQTLNPRAAVSSAKRLIEIEKVAVAFCSFADDAEAIGPLFNAAQIPLVVLWDSTNALQRIGEFVFSNGFSTEIAGEIAARFARNRLKMRRVAIVSHLSPWCVTASRSFKEHFNSLGGEIIAHEELSPETVDFKPTILRIRSLQPDGIYFPLAVNPSVFLRQMKQSQLRVPLISGDTMLIPGEVAAAQGAAEGVFFTSVYRDGADQLIKAYKARYGGDPIDAVWVSFGYDGVTRIVDAFRVTRAQRKTLREGLLDLLGTERSANRVVRMFKIMGNTQGEQSSNILGT